MEEKYTFGLIDWELLTGASQSVFNLDLMQTSTYLKNRGKFVQLITHYDPSLLKRYGKVYIFKDIDDNFYPKEFFCAPNVEVIGAVSGLGTGIISPEVRHASPDCYIYLNAKRYFEYKKVDRLKFEAMLNSIHIKILNEKREVSNDWKSGFEKPERSRWKEIGKRTVLIHDSTLTTAEGAYSAIQEVLRYQRTSSPHMLWFKHPLVCGDDREFLKWREIPKNRLLTRYSLNHIPTLFTLIESIELKATSEYRRCFSARGGENSVIYIHIQPDVPSEEFIARLYDLMLFSLLGRGYHTQVQVVLPTPTYLDEKWYSFVQVLNDFWLYADEIGLSARNSRSLSFNQYFHQNYEVGLGGLSLAQERIQAEGTRQCRRLLYNQNYDFFRLLDVRGHLEYDSEKRQLNKGGQ